MADPKATSKLFNRVGSFLARLERVEVDPYEELLQPVITDATKRQHLVEFLRAGMLQLPPELVRAVPCPPEGFVESEGQKLWRGMFGEDYFGIPEVARTGRRFSETMLGQRSDVRLMRDNVLLSPEDSLNAAERCIKECPGQFVCVACLPESVCSIHARESALFIPELQGKDAWMLEQCQRKEWSRKRIRDYYILLRKEPVPDSHSMHAERQKIWLRETHPCERFARPEHIVYADSVCYKATEGRLQLYSGDVWGRTLIRTAHGRLVDVGRSPQGLVVDRWRDNAHPHAGVPSLWVSF